MKVDLVTIVTKDVDWEEATSPGYNRARQLNGRPEFYAAIRWSGENSTWGRREFDPNKIINRVDYEVVLSGVKKLDGVLFGVTAAEAEEMVESLVRFWAEKKLGATK